MSAREYWLAIDSEPHGPVTLEELSRRYRSGTVGPETLVWFDGLPEWQPLSSTKLRQALQDVPPPLPAQVLRPQPQDGSGALADATVQTPSPVDISVATTPVASVYAESPKQPLVAPTLFQPAAKLTLDSAAAVRRAASYGQRVAARLAETMVWYFPVALLLGWLVEFGGVDVHAQVAAWLLMSLVLVGEAVCLGIFGNSAGKALVGIRVARLDGAAWDFPSVFKRAFGLWALGMFFGILFLFPMLEDPTLRMAAAPVALAPYLWQSGRVLFGKPAGYDEERFLVYRHRTHWWRTLVVFAFAATAFAVTVGALR